MSRGRGGFARIDGTREAKTAWKSGNPEKKISISANKDGHFWKKRKKIEKGVDGNGECA